MNLAWTPSAEAIRLADEQPWDGPAARFMRPLTYEAVLRCWIAAVTLWALAGVSILAADASFGDIGRTPRLRLAAIGISVIAYAALLLVIVLVAPPSKLRRYTPITASSILLLAPVLLSASILAIGAAPGDAFVIVFVEAPIFAFFMLRPLAAIAVASLGPVTYGCVLVAQHSPHGLAKWLVMTLTVAGTGIVVGGIAAWADRLSASERAARTELASLNSTLETRVSTQLAELEHLGKLRRFLSPEIANAVASDDFDRLTQPHRRRIAIFFCDLRGFTAFTNAAEPEDVVEVLRQYYETVGGLLRKYDATIANFTGDGIMAFFGDPVPIENPALVAVQMASELLGVMEPVVADWRHRGHDLDHGVGLSYGYATLGVVGTDTRFDYTPMGSIVNLAARLCSHASGSQLLMDQATHAASSPQIPSSLAGKYDFKGFSPDTSAYALDHRR